MECGGAQRMVSDLCRAQCRAGHHVTLLTLFKSPEDALTCALPSSPYFHTISLDLPSFSSNPLFASYRLLSAGITLRRTLKALQQKHPAHVAHVHLFPASYLMALSAPDTLPLLFTEHNTDNRRRHHPALRPLERFFYSRYSAIAAVSPAATHSLTQWLGGKQKIDTILNGIDLSRFYGVSSKEKDNVRYVLMISRFAAGKDYASVIRAAALLKENTATSSIRFLFAGSGPLMEEMQRLAEECGVAHSITFLGTQEDIPSLIRKAWVGIQSSHYEGFGLSAIEMMAGALPVIATDIPGLRDATGDAAILVPHASPEAIASAIERLTSPVVYQEYAARSLQRAATFDIHLCSRQYEELYQRISTSLI